MNFISEIMLKHILELISVNKNTYAQRIIYCKNTQIQVEHYLWSVGERLEWYMVIRSCKQTNEGVLHELKMIKVKFEQLRIKK